jgi:hypothetical protein
LKGKKIEEINKEYYWGVIRDKIYIPEAVNENESSGSYLYIDLGPSGTMANFVKYNLKPDSISKTFNIITPFDNELKNLDCISNFFSI